MPGLLCVGRIEEAVLLKELLLDKTRRNESSEHVRAASSVIGSRASGTTERLLTDEGSSCFAV
jgi:hypothetical protein